MSEGGHADSAMGTAESMGAFDPTRLTSYSCLSLTGQVLQCYTLDTLRF